VGAVIAQLALAAPTKPGEQRQTAEVRYDCAHPDGKLVALTLSP
jgi:hypothetical protein